MPGNNTSKQPPTFDHTKAVHEPFSWLSNAAKEYPTANFVALAADICAGIHTCLHIFNSSDIQRVANASADPGDEVMPAVTLWDAEALLRFAMSSAQLLQAAADHELQWLNEHAPALLKAMRAAAK